MDFDEADLTWIEESAGILILGVFFYLCIVFFLWVANKVLTLIANTREWMSGRTAIVNKIQQDLSEAELQARRAMKWMKKGDIIKAKECWNETIGFLEGLYTVSPEKIDLLIESHFRAAECELRLHNYERTVYHCNQILAFGQNWRAYFKRGQAYFNLKKYQLSLCDCNNALTLKPINRAIRSKIGHCQKMLDRQYEQGFHPMVNQFYRLAAFPATWKHQTEDFLRAQRTRRWLMSRTKLCSD